MFEPGLTRCQHGDHQPKERLTASPAALDRASRLFRALGDASRLRLLEVLMAGESCVTELVETLGEKFSTVSQRLRLLRNEGLVLRRRAGTHIFYALADRHVVDLIQNALAHAAELNCSPQPFVPVKEQPMAHDHANHDHDHGPGCGHTAVQHNGHTDYLHDGHLHHPVGQHVEEHTLDVGGKNPAACTPQHDCGAHAKDHTHGPGCGHEAVPHGEHTDYLVDGHLHHPHNGHCDDHGPVETVQPQKQ